MTKNVTAQSYNLFAWSDGTHRSYPPVSGPAFPRTGMIAISGAGSSGDQTYGPTPYSNQVAVISNTGYFSTGTYSSNPVAWMGRFDIVLLGGQWEGWSYSAAIDRGLLVDCIKQVCQVPGYLPAIVWQYDIYEALHASGGNYASLSNEAAKKNWYLYSSANQTGSTVSPASGENEMNWAVAWPGGSANVPADQQFSPGRDVATFDGSPEDYTQYAAAYFTEMHTLRHSSFTGRVCGTIAASAYKDSRFSPTLPYNSASNPDTMKAPNLDAIYTDNCYGYPRYSGYYNLQSEQGGGNSNNVSSAAAPWLIRGSAHFSLRYQQIMGKAYPGRTYYNIVNFASWDYVDANGYFSTNTNGLQNLMHGGVIEAAFGASFSLTPFSNTIHAYHSIMDFCLAPKLVMVNSWVTDAATSLVSADYQNIRYYLSECLLDNGYFSLTCSNGRYRVDDAAWVDEFGGNPGTNIPKGWLGYPKGTRPSAAAVNGVWMRDFDNGVVLCNPASNSAQTITLAQINTYFGSSYTFHFFKGVQNPSLNSNGVFSSVALQAGDGVLLLKP